MLNVMVTEDLKLLTEENQKLKEENKILKAYNEQMQNENSYLGEQADKYKEWYQVAKERVMRLEAKIEAYKEILRSVLKDCKNV